MLPQLPPKIQAMYDMRGFSLPATQGWLSGWPHEEHKYAGGVGVGERRGGEGGHKDSWNSYPYSQVKASGSTTSIGQPKLETPGRHNSY